MWDSSDKASFLAQAFQEVHASNRSIRERMFSIVAYTVTIFLVTASFFLLQADPLNSYAKIVGLIVVGIVIATSRRLLTSTFNTLMAQAYIQRSLEEQMLFHEAGAYGRSGAPLYPPSASADKLTDETYYREQMKVYRSIIGIFGGVALLSVLLSLSK